MNPNPDTTDCENPWVYYRKRFVCVNCNVRFKEKWLLERHVSSGVCLTGRKVRGPGKVKEDLLMEPTRVNTKIQNQLKPRKPDIPTPLAENIDIRLPKYFKIYLAGPARSGKTTLCHQLLQNLPDITREPITKTVYVYRIWQDDVYVKMQSEGLVDEFIQCTDEKEDALKARIDEYLAEKTSFLLILDDCMHVSKKMQEWIAKLFTTDARHQQMSLVFVRQKFYGDKEFVREIDRNADVLVLTENKREVGQICHQLASQMGVKANVMVQICQDAMKKREDGSSGYLWINLSNDIDSRFMFMTDVLKEQGHIVYTYEMMSGGGFKKMILMSQIRYDDLKTAAEREVTDTAVAPTPEQQEGELDMEFDTSGMPKTLASKRGRDDEDEDVDDPSPQRQRFNLTPPPVVPTPPPPAVPSPPRIATPPSLGKRPRADDDDGGSPKRPRVDVPLAGISPLAQPTDTGKTQRKRRSAPTPSIPLRPRSTRQASRIANQTFQFQKCNLCNQRFNNVREFERHVRTTHRDGD